MTHKQFSDAIGTAVLVWAIVVVILMLSCSVPGHAQTAGAILPNVKPQFLDNNGLIAAGGKLCTYLAGTSTPEATYVDSGLVTPNADPVLLDAAGRPSSGAIYLSGVNYKFVLMTAGTDNTCATGSVLWTQDNVGDIGQILKANLALSSGSSLIGFLQAGAGAVALTAQAKMRQIVNAADFGAATDGTTDATTALNNALGALPAAGGTVVLQPGTYLVSCIGCAANSSALTPVSNTTIQCSGKGSTTIKLAASSPQSIGILGGTGLSRVTVNGCTFDGNKGSQTNGQFGILCFDCDHWIVQNSRFQNFTASPVNFGWTSTGSADNIVADNEFSAWGQTSSAFGVVFIGAPKRNVLHHNIFNCSGTSNTGFGIDGSDDLGLASAGLNNVADHNTVVGCVNGAIIEDADYTVLDGNQFINQLGTASASGFGVLQQHGQINHHPVGSRIVNNVITGLVSATLQGSCINVNEGSDDTIEGNLCKTGTNVTGINLGSVVANPNANEVIALNTLDGFDGTGIYVQNGTDLIVAQNSISNLTGVNGSGIQVITTAASPLNRVSILGNTVKNVSKTGILAAVSNSTVQNLTIADNTFTNVGFGGAAANSHAISLQSGVANATIHGNRCVDTQGAGATTNNCVNSDASSTNVQAYGDQAFGIGGTLYSLSTATLATLTVPVPFAPRNTSTMGADLLGVPATIKGFVTNTQTVTPGGILAGTCVSTSLAVPGASDAAAATWAQPLAALGSSNLTWSAFGTTGGGAITLVICNPTVGNITPNNVNWALAQLQ